jgi:MtN3 and saliva related transmembrane protein
MNIELIGFLAGTLTTISFLPQVITIWKTKSTKDISFSMYLLFLMGIILWLLYGILIHSYSIIIANGITVLLVAIIFYFKIKYK